VAALWLFAGAAAVAAQSPAPRDTTYTLLGGGGPSAPTTSVSFRGLSYAAMRMSVPMNFLGSGEGIFDGHWEYQEELFALTVTHGRTALAAGYTPIGFRYVMGSHGRVRPYVGGAAGMLYATRRIPEGSSRYNFTPQAEAGVAWGAAPHRAWNLEVRYAHISNAGLFYPQPNPGINSVLFLGGWTF
jgi:hypothetical protein